MQKPNDCILIVEDSETQAVLLSAILEKQGWQTQWAATAEAALQSLAEKGYSMVIVDYHLPGMNGDQLCRHIKMNIHTRGTPVLMLTIEDSQESEKHALESGADAFAPKESDNELLVARIRSLLDRTRDREIIIKGLAQFHQSHILAVDDSPTYLTFLAESFKKDGILIDMADSGNKALQMIQAKDYDCILLDLAMPEMDGIACCREIHKKKLTNESLFVVMMLTAHEGKQEMMEALDAGADDFVGKSNDISIIKARLAALLRRRHIQLDNQKIWQELKEKELEAERARIEKEAAEEKAVIAQELRDSEERFRKIFESNSDGVVILDADGSILMINSSALWLLGKSEEDLRRDPFSYEIGSKETSSVAIKDQEGHERIIEIKRVEIPWGVRNAHLLAMRNVTERERRLQRTAENLREAMKKLTASQFQLVEAEKLGALGVLTAGIAHELNNPMMGMLNYAQYGLKHVPESNKAYAVLGDLEREIKRCIEIVNNLLTFSRMEKASDERFESIRCSELFDRVLNLLKYRIEKEKISVFRSGESDLPEIPARVSNLQQVFLNIIGNAMDALTDVEEKILRITGFCEKNYVGIKISDNGSGIDKNSMPSIFDPFFTTKEPGKGTGLGLSVSRSIIEAHKGSISCESETGSGTTFSIKLPRTVDG